MPTDTMMAVVKPEAKPGAEVRQVPRPKFGPREVLVKVSVAGICGTDLHIYDWDPWAQDRIKPPLVPGHEFCGTVAAVGKEVTTVKEGDFVSAEMHVACGKCLQCRLGEAHICRNVTILGIDSDGAFAEYTVIPETNIWKIDPRIAPEYAAILDPLGNAVYTVCSGEIIGQSIAIIGCGPIGQFAIAVARAVGAGTILAIEPNAFRRELAQKMKADVVLDPTAGSTKDDVRSRVLEITNGAGVDVVAEMSGSASGIRSAFDLIRMGGRVSLLGTPTKNVDLDLARGVIFKGAQVHGIHGRLMYKTWYQMSELLKHDRLDLAPAITDRVSLKDFSLGMDRMRAGQSSKVLVYPNGVK